jgi:hypothetical protein
MVHVKIKESPERTIVKRSIKDGVGYADSKVRSKKEVQWGLCPEWGKPWSRETKVSPTTPSFICFLTKDGVVGETFSVFAGIWGNLGFPTPRFPCRETKENGKMIQIFV